MMRMLLGVVLLSVSSVSFGAFISGHELLAYSIECEKHFAEKNSEAYIRSCGLGQSYIMGVFDTAHALNARWLFEKRFCKPDGLERHELLAIVRKYMHDHPEQMKFAAAGIVYDALTQAYPCE